MAPLLQLDRSSHFGEGNKHSYMIVADWVKAAHKSQSGDMNQAMHRGETETFWFFEMNGNDRIEEAKALFKSLVVSGYQAK